MGRLEKAVAQQQVHIIWQKRQLDQVNTLERVIPQLVHGTKPLWGPGAASLFSEPSSALKSQKLGISHRLQGVQKILDQIMAKDGDAELGTHLGIDGPAYKE